MSENWSEWCPYNDWHPDINSFKETIDGGQAFCWNPIDEHAYEGIVQDCPLRIRWQNPGRINWSSPETLFHEADALFGKYLGSNQAYQNFYNTLPWRSDSHLKRCMEAFPSLRILGQPPGETLLGFLCSATKQIVQIKEMLALLRERFGNSLHCSHRSLPSWEQLCLIHESDLRECKFGFRAANIKKTAAVLIGEKFFLENIHAQPYDEAKSRLMDLPGVGEKIADCVLLFGYHKLSAFPVDTWILKVMKRHYDLVDWTPKQVAHFGRTHFGDYAGLAQQFLFAWERNQAGK